MWRLERVWEEKNRTPVLLVSGAIVLMVAFADWWTKPFFAFGFLYLFPIMLAAGFLPRSVTALLGVGCAILSEVFSSLERSTVRLAFETLALAGCGLFVAELVRNRRLTLEAQARLKALVETSPAAIVTVDERCVGRKLPNSALPCSAGAIAAMVNHSRRMFGFQPIRKGTRISLRRSSPMLQRMLLPRRAPSRPLPKSGSGPN
jgi:hypothetical protein